MLSREIQTQTARPWMLIVCVTFVFSLLFAVACDSEDDADSTPDGDVEKEIDIDGDLDVEMEPETEKEIEIDPWDTLEAKGEAVRDMLGVSSHMKQDEGENWRRDLEFEKYQELGGAWIREDYHWHKIEPVDDEWHFEKVSTQVDMARQTGSHILAMLAYTVDWAIDEGEYSSMDPAEYAEFAGAVAAEFCDDIKHYEIWNEPNLTRFWKPEPDPNFYGQMLKAAYASIKTACPDAKVLFGGLSALDDNDPVNWWAFADRVYENHPDICQSFDIMAIHPYTFNQEFSPERDYLINDEVFLPGQTWMTDIIRDKMTTMGCGDAPVWYTEAGWPSYDIDEEIQGHFLARSVLIAAKDGIERYFWYTFWDSEPRDGWRPHESFFGLYAWPGTDEDVIRPKPAWVAMKGLEDVIGDYRFAGDLSPYFNLPNDVYVLAFTQEGGQVALALWDGRDNPDGSLAQEGEGGWDTSYDLTLTLPESATNLVRFAIDGTETERPEATATLEMKLTPEVQYLTFTR